MILIVEFSEWSACKFLAQVNFERSLAFTRDHADINKLTSSFLQVSNL